MKIQKDVTTAPINVPVQMFIDRVSVAGSERKQAARLMLSSAFIALGRAAILADKPDYGVKYLKKAMQLGVQGLASTFLDLLIREAERCSQLHMDREAVQRWQDIICLLEENTPDYIYQRLSYAYQHNEQGFGGAVIENHLWGDCHKHDVLSVLHERLAPDLYLEIGVDEGLSLARAHGRAIGIDPRPDLDLKISLPKEVVILPMSSDSFFRNQAASWLKPGPELVFIDGMHLFEFALRDFINVEHYAVPNTLVVIDDIYPCHPTQALRRRRSGAWTGDIWKLHQILREVRPDLTLLALNSFTSGLLLIAGLDPDNHDLKRDYNRLVSRFVELDKPSEAVLDRYGAIPSDHPLVGQLVNLLRLCKETGQSVEQMRRALFALKPAIAEAEAEYLGRAESLAGENGTVSVLPRTDGLECLSKGEVIQSGLSMQPSHFIPHIENGHLLISGTGRSGTTLLVQIFTYLGLDTGFMRDEVLEKVDSISAAGLEHRLFSIKKPYIIKSPWLSDDIERALSEGIHIDCVIIPTRNLFSAAESRRRVYKENARLGLDAIKAPGSLWKTDKPEEQEFALATQFYKLLYPLISHNVPVIFLDFPAFAKDFDYFYSKLQPVFDGLFVSKTAVKVAFMQVVDLRLIHDFAICSGNLKQRGYKQ